MRRIRNPFCIENFTHDEIRKIDVKRKSVCGKRERTWYYFRSRGRNIDLSRRRNRQRYLKTENTLLRIGPPSESPPVVFWLSPRLPTIIVVSRITLCKTIIITHEKKNKIKSRHICCNLWISKWRSDAHNASTHSSCPANPADGISDGTIASCDQREWGIYVCLHKKTKRCIIIFAFLYKHMLLLLDFLFSLEISKINLEGKLFRKKWRTRRRERRNGWQNYRRRHLQRKHDLIYLTTLDCAGLMKLLGVYRLINCHWCRQSHWNQVSFVGHYVPPPYTASRVLLRLSVQLYLSSQFYRANVYVCTRAWQCSVNMYIHTHIQMFEMK